MEIIGDLVNLDKEELNKLRLISPGTVEQVRIANELDIKNLQAISENHNNHYHQLIWKVRGWINAAGMIEGYNRLLADFSNLRTYYIKDVLAKDVLVTYKHMPSSFPIIDISKMNAQTQACKIVSVAAAECRRLFNPQKSPVLRMQAFALKEDVLAVIITFIPDQCRNISRPTLEKYIFKGMTIEQGAYGALTNSAGNLNDTIRVQNLEYWKEEIEKVKSSKVLLVPGQKEPQLGNGIVGSAYKKMDEGLIYKLLEFAQDKQVSIKSILMYSWLQLLAITNNEDNPTLAVIGDFGEPTLYPIQIHDSDNMDSQLSIIDSKIENASKYGYIDEQDEIEMFGNDFAKYFNAQLYFFDIESMMERDNWLLVKSDSANNGIGLTIRYNFSHKDCFTNYIYDSDIYNNEEIENLHIKYELFMKQILKDGKVSKEAVDIANVVSDSKEYERRLYRMCINIINDTSIFRDCNGEMIAKLAKAAVVYNLSVDDEICREQDTIDSIYIVAEGKLEESVVGSDGMVRSLRIISPKNVIGYEALQDMNIVMRTYTVASDEATVIKVPRDIVLEVLNDNPMIWKAILADINKHLWKVENLWIME